MLVDFYGSWCVWCQRMDQTLADPQVRKALQASFYYVKLDVGRFERYPGLRAQYGVTALPRLIVFNRDGSVRVTQRGYNDAQAFLAFLARARATPEPATIRQTSPPAAATRDAQLLTAAQSGDLATVKQLVRQGGVNLNAICPRCGATPLGHAASAGRYEVVEYLLTQGADVNAGRHTALHQAAGRGDLTTAGLLLRYKANPNTRCPNCGATPLSAATAGKHTEMVRLLRLYGATR